MSETQLYTQLGQAVAARRKDLHLTQEKLASRIGLARASLANVESGRQRLMVHQLFLLADALELRSIVDLVPPTWKFTQEPDMATLPVQGNLSDGQHAVVQNLLRSALASSKGKK